MSKPHALIIDDNLYNVEVLENLLKMNNASFTTIQDPTLVDRVVTELDRVDVVFLDLEMPELDGYQVLNILKKNFGLGAPVVAYTVHTSQMKDARAMGFDSFLGKPLDPERFSDQLRRILAGEAVWEIS